MFVLVSLEWIAIFLCTFPGAPGDLPDLWIKLGSPAL